MEAASAPALRETAQAAVAFRVCVSIVRLVVIRAHESQRKQPGEGRRLLSQLRVDTGVEEALKFLLKSIHY
jgi:hypothetical protein